MLSGVPVSTPAGSVSVKLMPDCAGLPAPLVSVKVSTETAFTSTVAGANALVSAGWTTESEALAVPPVSATGPVALTVPLVLLYVPGEGTVTSTVTVQVPEAAMVPALNAIDAAPPAGAKVGAPHPLVVAFGAAATTIAAGATGNVSAKATPVSAVPAFGLVSVKVSVTVRPGPLGPAKDFAIVGAEGTVIVALVAVGTVPPLVVVIVFAATVFV